MFIATGVSRPALITTDGTRWWMPDLLPPFRSHLIVSVPGGGGIFGWTDGPPAPGHEVITESNGREALQHASKRRPDLVLLDFMMPIMGGSSVVEAMREDPALCNIPVVIMSSLPESTISESVSGMYAAFLRKPFKLKAVIDVVDAVLGRKN
jgi:CheY-like chemotaxis protein